MANQDIQSTLTLAVRDLDAALDGDARYRVSVGLDSAMTYEVTGDLPLLDDLGLSDDAITLEWEDGRMFTATLLRKMSQNAMADFADGDSNRILETHPKDISQEIGQDPTIDGLRVFYDAVFDDPDGPAQDHTILVKFTEA